MRWFITKKHLVAFIGLLVALLLLMAFTSCIPVTMHNERDAQGKPIPLAFTPAGGQDLKTGEFKPTYPVSDQPPAPPTDWWPMAQQVLLTLLGVAAGGGAAVPMIRRARTAISLVANLADAQEQAFTPEAVEANKKLAAQMQEAAGVRGLIQKVRGK